MFVIFANPKPAGIMANDHFSFKEFTIYQDRCAFKVGTDGVLLGACADVRDAGEILDIGTGSGLIAIMLAQRGTGHITAIEPDYDSFLQASENASATRWKDRISVINTELQKFTPGKKFDLIVSNPPYFTGSLRNPDERKAATRHNDNLSSGDLLEGVSRLLTDNGLFEVIMPFAEGNVLIAESANSGLYCKKLLKIKPLPTSPVRRLIITFSRERQPVRESFLTIEHGVRHEFTDEYKSLMKDFYLKF